MDFFWMCVSIFLVLFFILFACSISKEKGRHGVGWVVRGSRRRWSNVNHDHNCSDFKKFDPQSLMCLNAWPVAAPTVEWLRYFFNFLKNVSLRTVRPWEYDCQHREEATSACSSSIGVYWLYIRHLSARFYPGKDTSHVRYWWTLSYSIPGRP